jgi:hypothetical protein
MDPDETLKQIRYSLNILQSADYIIDIDDVDTLTTLVEALDGWISRGGFLPSDWRVPCPCLYCAKKDKGQ